MCDMDENDLMDPSLIRATTEPELLFSAGLAPRSRYAQHIADVTST